MIPDERQAGVESLDKETRRRLTAKECEDAPCDECSLDIGQFSMRGPWHAVSEVGGCPNGPKPHQFGIDAVGPSPAADLRLPIPNGRAECVNEHMANRKSSSLRVEASSLTVIPLFDLLWPESE
jgi:hypothetical protein